MSGSDVWQHGGGQRARPCQEHREPIPYKMVSRIGWQPVGMAFRKYRWVENAYHIYGETFLLLTTKPFKETDNVLWNPLTGDGRHLDHEKNARFLSEHGREVVPQLIRPIRIYGERILEPKLSPGQTSSCHSIPIDIISLRLIPQHRSLNLRCSGIQSP